MAQRMSGAPAPTRSDRYGLRELFQLYRGRIALLFVLVVVIYFLIAFGEQAWRARQLQAEAAQQRAAIAALETKNAALREQLDTYSSDAWLDYVQARARRDLNLANPGETVLLVRWAVQPTAPTPAVEPQPELREQPNWRRWLEVFGGG